MTNILIESNIPMSFGLIRAFSENRVIATVGSQAIVYKRNGGICISRLKYDDRSGLLMLYNRFERRMLENYTGELSREVETFDELVSIFMECSNHVANKDAVEKFITGG